jgi:glycosyltransferase involved in cell wall biosynthesis
MPASPASPRKTALIVVSEDWYFISHRTPLARQLQKHGFDVHVACRLHQHEQAIKDAGCIPIALGLNRDKLSPKAALQTVNALAQLYQTIRPDVIIHCTLLLSFLGGLAVQKSKHRPPTLNLITGLGYSFLAKGIKATFIRAVIKAAFLKFARQGRHTVIVQNQDDYSLFKKLGFKPDHTLHIIRGSGVDDHHFCPAAHPPAAANIQNLRVAFVARMLWAKGLAEVIEAARILQARGRLPDIQLIGEPDPANPHSATAQDLQNWADAGLVSVLGRRHDIADLYRNAHIAILPSWREGLPKSLLEAAACGLPLITTDAPGCRELVEHGKNGLLIPLQDPEALANAIDTLAQSPEERQRMGRNARKRVEESLNERAIAQQTVDVIIHMLSKKI